MEQEVFSESIKLNVDRGSMYVNVVIGNKTTPMVVDSGATLISLPNGIAAELGITVPADARQIAIGAGRWPNHWGSRGHHSKSTGRRVRGRKRRSCGIGWIGRASGTAIGHELPG